MTTRNQLLFIVLALGLSVLSCQKVLIKPDPTSDPERNFEMFWNDLNNGYPYFVEDKIDWKERYDAYRPTISSKTTAQQLFDTFGKMLKGFSDGHLHVEYNGQRPIQNEKTEAQFYQLVRANSSGASGSYDINKYYYDNYMVITKNYLETGTYHEIMASDGVNPGSSELVCYYGLLQGTDILYFNITSFLTDYDFAPLLKGIFASNPSLQGMVLDLRMNSGGNLGTMWKALSVFVKNNEELTYGYNKEKVGPLPENFGPERYFAVRGSGLAFSKGIVVLANRFTVSSAEHATMAMRQAKKYNANIKIVGDYTFGATSFIVQRTLPIGINYTLVNNKTYDINKTIIERTGVKPDVLCYLTEDKIRQQIDEQLLKAKEIIVNNLF